MSGFSTRAVLQLIDSKYRVDWNNTDRSIPITTAWTLLYEHVGDGALHGFHVSSDTDKLLVQLVVDDEVLFTDMNTKFLSDAGLIGTGGGGSSPSVQQSGCGPMAGAAKEEFDFSLRYPLVYRSSMRVYVKKSDNTAFKILRYLFQLSKFTG